MSHLGSMDFRASAIATAFLSFGFYATAAFVLWHACLHQFERAVDRPQWALPPYPGYADLRGITFVDEGNLDPSTVPGDDPAGPASRSLMSLAFEITPRKCSRFPWSRPTAAIDAVADRT